VVFILPPESTDRSRALPHRLLCLSINDFIEIHSFARE
jgi:hypothetical protein